MRYDRFRPAVLVLTVLATLAAASPLAAAQSLEEICSSNFVCIVMIIVFLIISILSFLQKRAREQAAQQGPSVPGYGGTTTVARPPRYEPGQLAPRPPQARYGSEDYSPILRVQEPPRQRASRAPGACPRCGSTEIENFSTGEHKCQRCKKIFMD